MNFLFESSIFILGFITQAICAIGSGLIEVLCSPIVEACPFAQFLLLGLAWRNPHFHSIIHSDRNSKLENYSMYVGAYPAL